MRDDLGAAYLTEALAGLRALQKQANDAIEQLEDDELLRQLDPESNSVAVIMRHVAGNMRSRWTDFLTSDGEKPDRGRDAEFEAPPDPSRGALLDEWERGWMLTLSTIGALDGGDLLRTVMIRGEPHSVLRAIERQTRHYAAHVGQIVFLAKHWRGDRWRTLSIPRGESAAYRGPLRA